MRNMFTACLLSSSLLLAFAAPFNITELSHIAPRTEAVQAPPLRSIADVARDAAHIKQPLPLKLVAPVHSCTCKGRKYKDVDKEKSAPAKYFSNAERIPSLSGCQGPMERWILSMAHGDRAVYDKEGKFCGCITHEIDEEEKKKHPNGFEACHQ